MKAAVVRTLGAPLEIRVVTEGRRLEDVNACFDEVLAGEVPARLVFEM